MTVQELIDQLNQIEDKTQNIRLGVEYGYGCYSTGEVVCVNEVQVHDDDGEPTDDFIVVIHGELDSDED